MEAVAASEIIHTKPHYEGGCQCPNIVAPEATNEIVDEFAAEPALAGAYEFNLQQQKRLAAEQKRTYGTSLPLWSVLPQRGFPKSPIEADPGSRCGSKYVVLASGVFLEDVKHPAHLCAVADVVLRSRHGIYSEPGLIGVVVKFLDHAGNAVFVALCERWLTPPPGDTRAASKLRAAGLAVNPAIFKQSKPDSKREPAATEAHALNLALCNYFLTLVPFSSL